MNKIRRQPAIKGGRAHLTPSVLYSIEEKVEALARTHGVSKSWVVATILADAFHIKEQPTFYDYKPRRKAS